MVDLAALSVSVLNYMAPLLLASVGEIIAERSGIVNIGVEGIMLLGAFAAELAAWATGSPLLGLAAGLLVGAALGLLHAGISVYLRGDQIIAGIGVNFAAYGAAVVGMAAVWAGQRGVAPRVEKLPTINIAGVEVSTLALASIIVAVLAWLLLERTVWGLRLSACGEDPRSAEAMGVNVYRMRTLATVLGAVLAGAAGAYLVVGLLGTFTKTITGPGRGFIALANVAFSNWNPLLAILGSYVFGFFEALSVALSSGMLRIELSYPLKTIPYLGTLAVLVAVSLMEKGRMPRALGKPYIKE